MSNYSSFLKDCLNKTKDLASARRIQCLVMREGLDSVGHFWNDHLIRLFASCGSLQESRRIFCRTASRSFLTWNAIISATQKLGEAEQAMDLYAKMQAEGKLPDVVTYLCALKACCGDGEATDLLHQEVICRGIEEHSHVGSALIHSYASSGRIEEARKLFDRSEEEEEEKKHHGRNVVTWGAMISGYVRNGEAELGLELFAAMEARGIDASEFTISCASRACAAARSIAAGKLLHDRALRRGLDSDAVIRSSLLGMYLDCGLIVEAERVFFDRSRSEEPVACFDRSRDRSGSEEPVACFDRSGSGVSATCFDRSRDRSGSGESVACFDRSRDRSRSGVSAACFNQSRDRSGSGVSAACFDRSRDRSGSGVSAAWLDLSRDQSRSGESVVCFDRSGSGESVCFDRSRDRFGSGVSVACFDRSGSGESVSFDRPGSGVPVCFDRSCDRSGSGESACFHQTGSRESMYCDRSGSGESACFDQSFDRSGSEESVCVKSKSESGGDIVAWGVMMSGYVDNGHAHRALELFQRLLSYSGLEPNAMIYLPALQASGQLRYAQIGMSIHHKLTWIGLVAEASDSLVISNAVIDMYAKCGCLAEALLVFERLPGRDVVSWGALISGVIESGQPMQALDLLHRMMSENNLKPNAVILQCCLKASSTLACAHHGRFIHALAVKDGSEREVALGNGLIDMYSRLRELMDARAVFDDMSRRRDETSWGIMLGGYASNGDFADEALELYDEMLEQGLKPNKAVWLSILDAVLLGGSESMRQGRRVHAQIVRDGFELDVAIASKISEIYAKRGSVSEALRVFRAVPDRDVVSFGAMIEGLAASSPQACGGDGISALELFAEMKEEAGIAPSKAVFLSVVKACQEEALPRWCRKVHGEIVELGFEAEVEIASALTSMYSKRGCLDEAGRAFGALEAPNLVAWSALISGYVSWEQNAEAIVLYTTMLQEEEKIHPDAVLYATMLTAFTNAGAAGHGASVVLHTELVKAGLDDDEILWARLREEKAYYAGSADRHLEVYNKLGSDGGCRAESGRHKDQVSFSSSSSSSSSSSKSTTPRNLVSQLSWYFDEFPSGLDPALDLVKPEASIRHFGFAADILGRVGLVQEAECLVRTMPSSPDAIAWTTLLSSCRRHGAADLASSCFWSPMIDR